MTESETVYKLRPDRQRWTHIALHVKDIGASIDWYENHTHLKLLSRNEDEHGYGAWLGDPHDAESPFILVLAQFFAGKDPFAPAKHPALGPFAHMGIEVPERQMIDVLAAMGDREGCLVLGPVQMPPPIGYICFLRDPDGNTVEFSFDQGVYEKAKETWGSK